MSKNKHILDKAVLPAPESNRYFQLLERHPYLCSLLFCLLLNPLYFGSENGIPTNAMMLETVALLISRKTNFSVGQIVFSINIIIYAAAGLLFGWDRALYSLLTYFITFKVIDMVENGMEEAKSVMIITQDGTAMADTIFQQLGRTCTILEGTGLISGNKAVLYCVITRLELPAMRRIIHNADQSAFVTVSDVSEIIGNHIKQLPPQADADNKPT